MANSHCKPLSNKDRCSPPSLKFPVRCANTRFPILERIYKAHGDKKITIVGISQNDQRDTSRLSEGVRRYLPLPCSTIRTATRSSNAYGLTNVPTLFLIGQDGQIEISSVGWVKQEIEDINRKLAAAQQTPPLPIFKPGEEVRDFRAG